MGEREAIAFGLIVWEAKPISFYFAVFPRSSYPQTLSTHIYYFGSTNEHHKMLPHNCLFAWELKKPKKESLNLRASQRMAEELTRKATPSFSKKIEDPKPSLSLRIWILLASLSGLVVARARIFGFQSPRFIVSHYDWGLQTHSRLHCHGISQFNS